MSNMINSFLLALLLSLTTVHTVSGSEPQAVTLKEFQKIKDARKSIQEDLSDYEINNSELVTLYKIKSDKKQLAPIEKVKLIVVALRK